MRTRQQCHGLLVLATTVTLCSMSTIMTTAEARRTGGAAFVVPATLSGRAHHQQQQEEPRAFPSSVQQQQYNIFKRRLLSQHFLTNLPLDELASSIDDDSDDNLKHEGGTGNNDNDEEYSGPSGFYDVDHVDDEEETEGATFTDFDRDEDDILTEREDRFYVDERGHRRAVEKCILVGVEDLSAKRKLNKQRRINNNNNYNEYDNSNNNINAHVEEEDLEFTLEESLDEMRELIKTAGMECSGGKWLESRLLVGLGYGLRMNTMMSRK